MTRLNRHLLTLLLTLALAMPLLVLAQEATPPAEFDPVQLLSAFVRAIQSGQWPVAAVLVLVGLVWAVRKFGVGRWAWLATSEGGTVLAFATVLASVLGAAALVPGTAITWSLAWQACAAAFAAIGAWTGARRLLRALVPLVSKIPPPVGPVLVKLLELVAGEPAAVQVQRAAEKAYQPGPAPSAQAAAAELGKPPAP